MNYAEDMCGAKEEEAEPEGMRKREEERER